MQTICELTITPDPRLVGTVSDFLGAMCKRVLRDPELASRVVVATHELLENTMRYSNGGSGFIRVSFDREGATMRVVVDTENRADAERRSELVQLIADMAASPSRNAFYQALLRRTLKRSGSGLGLGRIHAEAEMDLSCEVRGDVVHLRAAAVVQDQAAQGGQ